MSSNRSKEAIGRALITAGSLALLGAAYQRLLRRRVVDWGATRDEAADGIPGHEVLGEMRIGATRAVTIDAPPEAIWPWLVQMGSGEGGTRTYEWIERLQWLDLGSADGIMPALHDLDDGDVTHLRTIAIDPALRVEVLTPVGALTTRAEDGSWRWTFMLVPQDASARVMSRTGARVSTPAEVVGRLRWRSDRW
jgi:hypothetical protein